MTSVLVQTSKNLLLQISSFFSFLQLKTLKTTISNCVWHAQHPNAGQNVQQAGFERQRTLSILAVEDADPCHPKILVCHVPIKQLAKPSKPAIKIIKCDTDADKHPN